MIHTQREREKNKGLKKKKYKYLCPAVTLHKNGKKGPTLNTKISHFLYIK